MPFLEREDSSRESGNRPPSPGTYIWPLLFIVVLCAGFVWYRRLKQRDTSFELRDILKYRPTGLNRDDGVRLSMDDMPSRHEFLVNNASTDSLPADVELPTVSRLAADTGRDVPYDRSTYLDDPAAAQGKAARVLGWAKGRRSARRGPVEGNEGDTSEEEGSIGDSDGERALRGGGVRQSEGGDGVFGIGEDEEGPVP